MLRQARWAERSPQGGEKLTVLVQRHATEHVAECRTEHDIEQRARSEEQCIPERRPQRVVQLVPQLDRQRPKEEQPEHEHEGRVHASKPAASTFGNANSSVPPAAKRQAWLSRTGPIEQITWALLYLALGDERTEHADAEVKAVQHHVGGEGAAGEYRPDRFHDAASVSFCRDWLALRGRQVRGARISFWTDPQDARQEQYEKKREERVEPHEAEQREQHVPPGNVLGRAISGAKQTMDDPRLPTEARPSSNLRCCNEGQGDGEQGAQSTVRASTRRFFQSSRAEMPMSAMKSVPRPAMM